MAAASARPAQTNLYLQRINAVLDHVRQHLTDDLSVDALAAVAGFSPFHFHRLFKSVTGETLSDLVTRLRLERAAALLRASPRRSITAVAFECGFQSASVFSRTFKRHFGLTARQWDRTSPLQDSKNAQVFDGLTRYTLTKLHDFDGAPAFTVRRRELPAQRVAYVRVYAPYGQPTKLLNAYHQLLVWYTQRGGRLSQTTLYGLSQDDPEITPLKLYRFDWGLRVPPTWAGDGAVSVVDWPACQVAYIHMQGDLAQEYAALQYLFRAWLPRSRYQPANLPGMEIYRKLPDLNDWAGFDLDCAIPVVPL